jgi:hypothetical protein
MDALKRDAILDFLVELGKRVSLPSRLMLLGGSALSLLGSPRPTLDIDYLGDDLHKDDLQRTIDQLAAEMHLEVEAVPLERFIPLPSGADERHQFYRRFGELDVYIFDPYAIAISKVERGFDTDIDDVIFLVRGGWVELTHLEMMLEAALTRADEFDLDRAATRAHLIALRRRLEALA